MLKEKHEQVTKDAAANMDTLNHDPKTRVHEIEEHLQLFIILVDSLDDNNNVAKEPNSCTGGACAPGARPSESPGIQSAGKKDRW